MHNFTFRNTTNYLCNVVNKVNDYPIDYVLTLNDAGKVCFSLSDDNLELLFGLIVDKNIDLSLFTFSFTNASSRLFALGYYRYSRFQPLLFDVRKQSSH